MKKIYFMGGFPRAGNTLLTSILNQNDNIFATGLSSIPEIFEALQRITHESLPYRSCPSLNNFINLSHDIFNSYYKDRKEDYIIERGTWTNPFNYLTLEDFCPNEIKIVFLVRSLKDIVKSYLKLAEKHPNMHINVYYAQLDKSTVYKSEVEEKVDFLFAKEGWIDRSLYSLKWLIDNDKTETIRILDYDDLVQNPQQKVNDLYEYFEIPQFNHDFSHLEQVANYGIDYNDEDYLGAPYHIIRTKGINKEENHITLPLHVVEMCNRVENWKGMSRL